MSYIPTSNDYDIIKNSTTITVKIEILNSDGTVLQTLDGITSNGTCSINADSYTRRTLSITIVPTDEQSIDVARDYLLWLDKRIHAYVGLYDLQDNITWYSIGYYVITDNSTTYDATTNELTVNCSDYMALLDGTINGELYGASSQEISAYSILMTSYWVTQSGITFNQTNWNSICSWVVTNQGSPIYKYNSNGSLDTTLLNCLYNIIIAYNTWVSSKTSANETIIYNLQKTLQNIYISHGSKLSIEIVFTNSYCMVVAHQIIKNVLIDTITQLGEVDKYIVCDIGEYKGTENNNNYETYRAENPTWDCLPYDLSWSAGDNVGSMLTQIVELYPNYDYFYDDDVLTFQMIPSCDDDDVFLDNDTIQELLVADSSETCTTNLSSVRNVSEIYGESFEYDYYTTTCTSSGTLYSATLAGYTEYKSGDKFGVLINSNCLDGMNLRIIGTSTLSSIPIYDENTDTPITASTTNNPTIIAGEIAVFQYKKKYNTETKSYTEKFYYLGKYQVHAVNALVDGSISTETYTQDNQTVIKYSTDYFRLKYNVEAVSLTVLEDSPFTVQAIGERPKVYSGDDYDNIQSNSVALGNAEYMTWQTCRLTDNITIKLAGIIPWMDVYKKISYQKANNNQIQQYISHNVTFDFENFTTTIDMYTFYSLYQ